METIRLQDKEFSVCIASAQIEQAIALLAITMNEELKGKNPLFIAVLNGSFMFAADLLRKLNMSCELSFVKLASYSGTTSSGQVKELLGLNTPVTGRTVVVLEDIVDTGNTLNLMYLQLEKERPLRILTATMLFKPSAFKGNHHPEYIAMSVADRFLVGYGLDYNGSGRNLPDIYVEL
jgi:hypoxanthine phosphoribosyltransferase